MYNSKRRDIVADALYFNYFNKVYTLKELYSDLKKYTPDGFEDIIDDYIEVELRHDEDIIETIPDLWRARDREDVKFEVCEVLDDGDVVVIRGDVE